MSRRVGISPRRDLAKRLRDEPWLPDPAPPRRTLLVSYSMLLAVGVPIAIGTVWVLASQ